MPIIFRSGTDIENDRNCDTVVAVDLGFANAKKSCGVAWLQDGKIQSAALDFGGCIDKVSKIIEVHKKTVLIIEAPLSGSFDEKGNPMSRGNFEKKSPDPAMKTSRYWYTGAGASICLGATFFLRMLNAKMLNLAGKENSHEVVLYEGFITFKDDSAKMLTHEEDAETLVECFDGKRKYHTEPVNIADAQTFIILTDVIALTTFSPIPLIIVPDKKS